MESLKKMRQGGSVPPMVGGAAGEGGGRVKNADSRPSFGGSQERPRIYVLNSSPT